MASLVSALSALATVAQRFLEQLSGLVVAEDLRVGAGAAVAHDFVMFDALHAGASANGLKSACRVRRMFE